MTEEAKVGGIEERLQISVQKLPRILAAAKRHVGPYNEVLPVFSELSSWGKAKGLSVESGSLAVVAYDDPKKVDASKLRADICLRVPDDFNDFEKSEGITQMTIRGGSHVVALYTGSYDRFSEVYEHVFGTVLKREGKACVGYPYEVYLNTLEDVSSEDELMTEIRVPVASIGCVIL